MATSSLALAATATAVTCALAVNACAPETLEANYDTYATATQAGALRAGWLPQWLPSGSNRIIERHNIDTNARMWSATVPIGAEVSLPAACVSAVPTTLPKPPFERTWWPEGAPHRSTPSDEFIYFKCGSEYVGLAAAEGKLIGWSLQ
jgi:hypothetical protein